MALASWRGPLQVGRSREQPSCASRTVSFHRNETRTNRVLRAMTVATLSRLIGSSRTIRQRSACPRFLRCFWTCRRPSFGQKVGAAPAYRCTRNTETCHAPFPALDSYLVSFVLKHCPLYFPARSAKKDSVIEEADPKNIISWTNRPVDFLMTVSSYSHNRDSISFPLSAVNCANRILSCRSS
jgi:hypothetical protein